MAWWDELGFILLRHETEPRLEHRPAASLTVQLHLTITLNVRFVRRDISTGAVDSSQSYVMSLARSRLFNKSNLTHASLLSLLRETDIPECDVSARCIDAIIRQARKMKRKKTYFLRVYFWGHSVEDVSSEMESALYESQAELERRNYGMVPANTSVVKKTLKRVRVGDGDQKKNGESRKRRCIQKGENCVICMEELRVGRHASEMPCSHLFHGGCIRKWLRRSHYCPVCRFEMPT